MPTTSTLPKPFSLLIAALAAVALSACAPMSSMKRSWVNPDVGEKQIKKVFVIGMGKDAARSRLFESQMSAIFEQNGIAAVNSSGLMGEMTAGKSESEVRELVRAAVAKSGADSVTVTRLVSADKTQRVVQGSTYMAPYPYYGNFYGYYYDSYSMMSTPDYVVEDNIYVIETNLYDVATEKLIWTGISETLNPKSSFEGVDSVGKLIITTLRNEGLIAEKPKS